MLVYIHCRIDSLSPLSVILLWKETQKYRLHKRDSLHTKHLIIASPSVAEGSNPLFLATLHLGKDNYNYRYKAFFPLKSAT